MPKKTLQNVTVADAYLAILADRGVDYLFANAGTDFAPLIEALADPASGQVVLRVKEHALPGSVRRQIDPIAETTSDAGGLFQIRLSETDSPSWRRAKPKASNRAARMVGSTASHR